MTEKGKRWLCEVCDRRYVRPRRLVRAGGLVTGECWACKGRMQMFIAPITANAFSGPSFVQSLLKRPPGPRDWSPRGKDGILREGRR